MPQEPPRSIRLDQGSVRRVLVSVVVAIVLLHLAESVFGATASFLFMLLIAWVVSIAMEPPVRALERRGMKRGLAAGLVLLAMFIALAAFLSAFGSMFFGQLAQAVQDVPRVIDSVVAWLNSTFHATLDAQSIAQQLSITPEKVASIASSVAGGVLGIVSGIVGFIFETLTILVFAYYLSAEATRVRRTIASWIPPARQRVFISVWDIAVAKTGGFVVSRVLLAIMSALAHIIAFWVIGVPFWMPLGLFAGITSQFIPTFGTYIGIIVPIAFSAVSEPMDCVWIVVFATVYQQIENYVLGPRVSRATMDLHPAFALAAVFVGAAMLGPIGAIIGIPLAAAIIAVVDTYGHRYELLPELHDDTD